MHHRNSQPAWLRSLIVTAFMLVIGLCLVMPGNFSRWPVASARPTVVYKTYGMDFSPYIDGQDPNLGTEITQAQLTTRLQIIANHSVWARSFGCTHGLEKFGMVAHSLGLKAAVGAWLSSNAAANDQEIANLISAANAGQIDLAIVGSEVLLRNDLSESQLIGYMNQVRQQIPANIPVATADVYGKLLEHPAVIAASDVVLPNYYPYWEGVSINTSIATLHRQHQLVVAAAQGKPVIVSETGWPSAGNVICNAVPSPANSSLYFLNFVSWARANNVSYFYFSALDETWKANYEGPQGSNWGVWTKDGVLKPGMQDVFDGQTMADNWTSAGVPGGPGTPAMEFSYVPPYSSSNNLFGQVFHVNTDDYKVAVYIYVGGWWTKPTFANPLTNIGLDGSWECDITTGGNDSLATQIVAFLVPRDYSPPPMSGGQTLPPALDQNSVARTEITRSSSSPYIAGQVTDSDNRGLNCVTISLTGSQTTTTHTLSNGNYSFLNLPLGGNYTVTPSHPSYTFNPLSLTFNNLGSNQTGNFAALPNYTIALSALPAAAGTVSGGGTFAAGSSHTVTATANSGYTFANWTEGGSVVSSSASYMFTLNSSRTLIANFTVTPCASAQMTSPTNGSTIAATTTFTWDTGTSNSEYWLQVGTTGVGSNNLYSASQLTGTSRTLSNLPSGTINVRLSSRCGTNNAWSAVDYTYTGPTVSCTSAQMTSPANGSSIPSTTTFTWNTGTGNTEYWLQVGTTGVGSNNLYSASQLTGTSRTLSGLPSGTIYVRLSSRCGANNAWSAVDYTYTGSVVGCTSAQMTSPANGSTLAGLTNFTWNAGTGNSEYWLQVGTTGVGSNNLYSASQLTGTSRTVSNLPSGTIYVRLSSRCGANNAWSAVDYTYIGPSASCTQAQMTSPANGSIIAATTTFTWNTGTGNTEYWLQVGTTGVGSSNLYSSSQLGGTSRTLNGLPSGTIYVRLSSRCGSNNSWSAVDYTYTEPANCTQAQMTSPANGSTIAATTTFTWNTGTGNTEYWLQVGTTGVGSNNLYSSSQLTGTSRTVSGLPSGTIYVRLSSRCGADNAWSAIDYSYTR